MSFWFTRLLQYKLYWKPRDLNYSCHFFFVKLYVSAYWSLSGLVSCMATVEYKRTPVVVENLPFVRQRQHNGPNDLWLSSTTINTFYPCSPPRGISLPAPQTGLVLWWRKMFMFDNFKSTSAGAFKSCSSFITNPRLLPQCIRLTHSTAFIQLRRYDLPRKFSEIMNWYSSCHLHLQFPSNNIKSVRKGCRITTI